jgi:hypothetical protein
MAQDMAPATFDIDRCALPRNPVESTALRMQTMGIGNGGTRHVLSRAGVSRCQPYGVAGGIPQEAKAEGNASDRLTCGRSCGSDRGE